MVGNVGTPGHLAGFFVYQYIERDALVGAYNTDDWWWHTWAEGYRFGAVVHDLAEVYVQPAVVFQRRLDYALLDQPGDGRPREDVLTGPHPTGVIESARP